jgi:hypothetical protein
LQGLTYLFQQQQQQQQQNRLKMAAFCSITLKFFISMIAVSALDTMKFSDTKVRTIQCEQSPLADVHTLFVSWEVILLLS